MLTVTSSILVQEERCEAKPSLFLSTLTLRTSKKQQKMLFSKLEAHVVLCTAQGHEQKHKRNLKNDIKTTTSRLKKVDLHKELLSVHDFTRQFLLFIDPVWHSFLYLANLKLQLCNRLELCQTVLSLLYKVVFTFSSCNKSQHFLICTNLNLL